MVDPNNIKNTIYVGLEYIESGNPRLTTNGSSEDVRSSKNVFHKGDIIYGKLRPYLDKAVLVDIDGICSSDIIVFSEAAALNRFLIYHLHTKRFLEHAIATTTGVNHPRTSWNSISKFEFGLPKTEEQKEIAKTLEMIDKKIQNSNNVVKIYSQLFKSMLHQLMTGKIRVNKIELNDCKY